MSSSAQETSFSARLESNSLHQHFTRNMKKKGDVLGDDNETGLGGMRQSRALRSKVMLVLRQSWLEASAPNFSLGPLSPRATTMASNEGIKEKKKAKCLAWLGPGMLAVSYTANKPLLLAILNSYPKKTCLLQTFCSV